MGRTGLLQEIRRMRFEEGYLGWNESRLTQEQAALVLGVSERTFRRYSRRYEEGGVEGLSDRRLGHASSRRVPADEVMEMVDRYRSVYRGWPVKHYYSWYCKEGGKRSYTWVKRTLQSEGVVPKAPASGGRGHPCRG